MKSNSMSAGRVAVVRRPGPRLIEGLTETGLAEPVDPDRAASQWQAYVDAFATAGWNIVECPPADDCPDAVFVEDPVVVFDRTAVVTRPGAPSRRPETAAIAPLFSELGLDVVSLTEGTLDGGDVLKVGNVAYVGLSDRTNEIAVANLAEVLGEEWKVVGVRLSGVLHLKSAITALPDGELIGLADNVDAQVVSRVREMPEAEGAHVVEIAPNHLLMSASAPESVRLLKGEGYKITAVDISEFEKLDGCVTCLSVRIR